MYKDVTTSVIIATINFIATMIIYQIIIALEIYALLPLSGQVRVAVIMSLFVGAFAFFVSRRYATK